MAETICSVNALRYLKDNIFDLLVLSCPEISRESIKIYWPSRKRTRHLGFIVNMTKATKNLNSSGRNLIPDVCSALLERSKNWHISLDQCSWIDDDCLALTANVAQMTARILSSVISMGFNYGQMTDNQLRSKKLRIMIHAVHSDNCSCDLTSARTIFIMKFVQRLLEFFGNTVLCATTIDKRGQASTICNKPCEQDIALRQESVKDRIDSFTSVDHVVSSEPPASSGGDVGNAGRMVTMDIGQYVVDNSWTFFAAPNLPTIPTCLIDDSGGITEPVCQAIRMEHFVEKHADSEKLFDKYLLVSSHGNAYRSTVALVIWQLLSELHKVPGTRPSIAQYVHGPVLIASSSPEKAILAKDLYSQKFAELKTCFTHKYNLSDSATTGDSARKLDEMFANLTDFCIKFELLRSVISRPVSVQPHEESHCKSGAFVMYGYARIASLLRKFETQAAQGVYPRLPLIGDVDLALLKKQEEQNLVALCGQYPDILEEVLSEVMDSLSSSGASPALHKVLRYLTDLSQELSVFYSRVHILGEPVPQLMPTMFARLWLLKSVKQILENIFALLDVEPIHQL